MQVSKKVRKQGSKQGNKEASKEARKYASKEASEQKSKSKRETKLLKEHVQRLNDENFAMTSAIENMRRFFEKVVQMTGDNE